MTGFSQVVRSDPWSAVRHVLHLIQVVLLGDVFAVWGERAARCRMGSFLLEIVARSRDVLLVGHVEDFLAEGLSLGFVHFSGLGPLSNLFSKIIRWAWNGLLLSLKMVQIVVLFSKQGSFRNLRIRQIG